MEMVDRQITKRRNRRGRMKDTKLKATFVDDEKCCRFHLSKTLQVAICLGLFMILIGVLAAIGTSLFDGSDTDAHEKKFQKLTPKLSSITITSPLAIIF